MGKAASGEAIEQGRWLPSGQDGRSRQVHNDLMEAVHHRGEPGSVTWAS